MQKRLSVVSFLATNSVPAFHRGDALSDLASGQQLDQLLLQFGSSGGAKRGGDRENGTASGFSMILWSTVQLGGSFAGSSNGNTSAYFSRRG